MFGCPQGCGQLGGGRVAWSSMRAARGRSSSQLGRKVRHPAVDRDRPSVALRRRLLLRNSWSRYGVVSARSSRPGHPACRSRLSASWFTRSGCTDTTAYSRYRVPNGEHPPLAKVPHRNRMAGVRGSEPRIQPWEPRSRAVRLRATTRPLARQRAYEQWGQSGARLRSGCKVARHGSIDARRVDPRERQKALGRARRHP
jgi:hypothetical protein